MKYTILLFGILFSSLGYSQVDEYKATAEEFVRRIKDSASISEIEVMLNDSLHGEDLVQQIHLIREELKSTHGRIWFYTIKVSAPMPLYNINLHNPKKRGTYGDIRIMFTNEDDLLIDKFQFFFRHRSIRRRCMKERYM